MNIVLTILIAVLQTFIIIIPLNGKLSDNRRKFPKSFTKRGYALLICAVLTMLFTIIVFIKAEKDEKSNQDSLNKQLKERDSVYQAKIIELGGKYISKLDSSDKNTIDALARYGLKYDSSEKKIEKIISSASKDFKKNTIEDPVLNICGTRIIQETPDSLQFYLIICSENATSYVNNIKLDVLAHNIQTDKYFPVTRDYTILSGATIVKGNFQGVPMEIIKNASINSYVFRVFGTYKKFDGKVISIDQFRSFNILEKKSGPISPQDERNIRQLFKL